VRRTTLSADVLVRAGSAASAAIFTAELPSYKGLSAEYDHAVIDHTVEYVNGNIHTNGMENFWSLVEARSAWNLCDRGTVPFVPLHR